MSVEQLTTLASRLRAIPSLGATIAREAAPDVLAAAKSTADAGTTPEGKAWAPRKKDGGRALAHAADAITVRAVGDVIEIVLSGVNVYQQAKRRILPERGKTLPSQIVNAILSKARAVIVRSL